MRSNGLLKKEEKQTSKSQEKTFNLKVLLQMTPIIINKRLQKPRCLNVKFMSAANNDNKANGNRYNSVLPISSKFFYCQLKQLTW
jgi:flagella basal body P-ring formation protein FlgA